jgi:hypothetical protein
MVVPTATVICRRSPKVVPSSTRNGHVQRFTLGVMELNTRRPSADIELASCIPKGDVILSGTPLTFQGGPEIGTR